MSLLSTASIPTASHLIATIAGDPGMGKSSLAALMPRPIFICAEDGLERVKEDIRPAGVKIRSSEDLRELLRDIANEEHDYKTIVTDSVTALEAIFIDEVMEASGNPMSINQAAGGYGAGPKAVAAKHESFRKSVVKIAKKRGMHVVFIAHADTETVPLLDRDEAYMRYSFRLGKHSLRPYVDEVDMVGFVRHEMFLRSRDKDAKVKRAASSGDRIFDCVPNAWSIAKNGFQITEPLTFKEGENPLIPYLSFLQEDK